MKEALIEELVNKAELDQEKASQVAEIVTHFLKNRIAPDMDARISKIIQQSLKNIENEIFVSLTEEPRETVMHKAGELAEDAGEKIQEIAGNVGKFFKSKFQKNQNKEEKEDKP